MEKKRGRKKAGNEKYILRSRFGELVDKEVLKRKMEGKHTTLADIYEEVAEYCGIGTGMIGRIKRGLANPSLQVSIKIAEFFNVKVEYIWYTELNENYVDDRERCSNSSCNKLSFSKGLCYKHYVHDFSEKKKEEIKKLKNFYDENV